MTPLCPFVNGEDGESNTVLAARFSHPKAVSSASLPSTFLRPPRRLRSRRQPQWHANDRSECCAYRPGPGIQARPAVTDLNLLILVATNPVVKHRTSIRGVGRSDFSEASLCAPYSVASSFENLLTNACNQWDGSGVEPSAHHPECPAKCINAKTITMKAMPALRSVAHLNSEGANEKNVLVKHFRNENNLWFKILIFLMFIPFWFYWCIFKIHNNIFTVAVSNFKSNDFGSQIYFNFVKTIL